MAGAISNLGGAVISRAMDRSPFAKVIGGLIEGGKSGMPGADAGGMASAPPVDGFNSMTAALPQATSTFGAPTAQTPATDYRSLIAQSAQKYGVDPGHALKVAGAEGGTNGWVQSKVMKGGKQEPSFGPFQMLVGGGDTGFPEGMGNQFMKETGLDVRDPANASAAIDFAMKQASQKGWGQWYGAKAVGINGFDGINGKGGALATTAPAGTSTFDRVMASAQNKPLPQMEPGQPVGNGAWQTATPEQQQPKPKTTFDRILDVAMKPHAPITPVQAPQVGDGQAPIDTGTEEVAQAGQGLQQKKLQPNQRATQRKQALTARTRYTA